MLFAIAFTLVMASCGQKSAQVVPVTTTDSTNVDSVKTAITIDSTTVAKDTLKQ